jgi:hypothetical protein
MGSQCIVDRGSLKIVEADESQSSGREGIRYPLD